MTEEKEPWVCCRCKAVRPESYNPKEGNVWAWLPNDNKLCPDCLEDGFTAWMGGEFVGWWNKKP